MKKCLATNSHKSISCGPTKIFIDTFKTHEGKQQGLLYFTMWDWRLLCVIVGHRQNLPFILGPA